MSLREPSAYLHAVVMSRTNALAFSANVGGQEELDNVWRRLQVLQASIQHTILNTPMHLHACHRAHSRTTYVQLLFQMFAVQCSTDRTALKTMERSDFRTR